MAIKSFAQCNPVVPQKVAESDQAVLTGPKKEQLDETEIFAAQFVLAIPAIGYQRAVTRDAIVHAVLSH